MDRIIEDLKEIITDYDYGDMNRNRLISKLESVVAELEEHVEED